MASIDAKKRPVMRIRTSSIALVLLGMYVIVDYTSVRGVPFWAVSYAMLVTGTSVLLLTNLPVVGSIAARSPIFITGLILWVCGFASVAAQTIVYPHYIVGDAATIFLLLVYFALGKSCPSLFLSATNRRLLIGFLLTAGFMAPVIAEPMPPRNFDPPHYLLFAAMWIALFSYRGKVSRILTLAAIASGLLFALLSGQRTGFVLGLVAASVVIWLRLRAAERSPLWVKMTALMALVTIIAAPVALVMSIQRDPASVSIAVLEETRLGQTGVEDASILSRLSESRDVLEQHISQTSWAKKILGNGHGSYYIPSVSYVSRNVTDEGYVHNIHFGPLLVLHRYGYLGFIAFLGICWAVFRDLSVKSGWWSSNGQLLPEAIFLVAVTVGLANFALRNSLTDPVFSYILAGWLYCRTTLRSERARSPGGSRRVVVEPEVSSA